MYSKILFLNCMAASLMIMAIHCDVTSVPNAFKPLDVNDPELNNALKKVEPQMNEKMNSTHLYRIEEIDAAQKESLDGITYKVLFSYGETECNKTDIDRIDSCKFIDHYVHCGADIQQKPNDKWKLVEFFCL
ncbi:kininogen-2-like [Dermatophagoides pteronyssinus]|uniref:Uncharacterized protein LOC113796621 n=2 Tax=Dermatophagoides pteronyssinus TaxID=6956 RepID=A0A6P6YCT5_DERPT|nr:uncharacterized protein LOC113796621 [Dermatophagoides pteronyssinus]KAH9426590.1 hypothetical protein DERP_002689 [Dermatophagoides pteronyssinus]